MRNRLHLIFFFALIPLLPLAPRPVLAQQALGAAPVEGEEEPPEDLFFDSVNVRVVNLVVWVTDKRGQPIGGLRQEDFELLEDGRPVEISNFFAVEGGNRAQLAPEALPIEATETAEIPVLDLPGEEPLYLIVYVDNFNISPPNRNRVLRRLRSFLYDQLAGEDHAMLVSYDRSLHIRQPFTRDADRLIDALTELEALSGHAVDRLASRKRALEEIESAEDGLSALAEARAHADYVRTEMEFSLRGLREVIQALAGLRGRKALLYVSDGLPMSPAEDLFMAVDQLFPRVSARAEAFSYDLAREFRRLASQANSNGITFYALDAGGAELHESISAAEGGTRQGGSRIMVDSIYSANQQETLYLLADATGGQAITNTNAVESILERVSSDFNTYYSLGFQPVHSKVGRFHNLEVKVKRKGVKIRHRRGYRDKTAETTIADGSLSSLYFGFERNTIDAQLFFRQPTRNEEGHFLVPLQVRIPIGKLTLMPQRETESHLGRFRVAFTVMSDDGDVSPVRQLERVNLVISEEQLAAARGKHYTYEVQLLMREGVNKVAVGIHDQLADVVSFLTDTVVLESG
jgi:VWFA-related protein